MSTLYSYPLKPASWNERDVLLFATSIDIDPSQLQYLYENHPKFTPFPTYPIALTFKHNHTTTTSFASHFTQHLTPPPNFIPDFPKLDITRVVDGQRTLQILRTIPTTSKGRDFRIRSTVTGVWDKGRGKPTIIQTDHVLLEIPKVATTFGGRKVEEIFTRMSETAIFMGQGGWGGPNPPCPSGTDTFKPARHPDVTHHHPIPSNAHLVYRLNGDYNPLHATGVQAAIVQPTPIMHGLYSWNVVAGIVVKRFGGVLRRFRARFAKPVRPGDGLEVEMWRVEKGGGEFEVRFEARVEGKVVLAEGVAGLEGGRGEVGQVRKVQELVSRL
ncbi:putative dehydratase NIT22 [Fulvia fulva]|nr:putative dehydratase NIT22 [Fulvia fulva]WPV21015.1 putative dehydratase NIT22 [Fulvia fulva]